MDPFRNDQTVDRRRRLLVGGATGALPLTAGLPRVQSDNEKTPASPSVKETISFAPLKHFDIGVLNVAYVEAGLVDGPPVFFCTAGPTTSTARRRESRKLERRPRKKAR
jgi:hypothetical protein